MFKLSIRVLRTDSKWSYKENKNTIENSSFHIDQFKRSAYFFFFICTLTVCSNDKGVSGFYCLYLTCVELQCILINRQRWSKHNGWQTTYSVWPVKQLVNGANKLLFYIFAMVFLITMYTKNREEICGLPDFLYMRNIYLNIDGIALIYRGVRQ